MTAPETSAGTPPAEIIGASGEEREPHNGVVLRTSALQRAFGPVRAVDGLDLEVRSGEVYGFLGVNGAGKTTTIRMLMGIIKPDAGTIEILGQRTRRTTVRQKQSIGYVSQEQTFYPWMTCRALGKFVGGFYPSWDNAEFERLLRVLELPPDRRASQLSGGMRVKLALALALAPRPALLILDEPTSGLDPVARREFLELIRMQAQQHQRTTFFSSHIIGEVERVADRVGIIHRGKMLYQGRLEELRASVRQVRIAAEKAAGRAEISVAEGTTGNAHAALHVAPDVPADVVSTGSAAIGELDNASEKRTGMSAPHSESEPVPPVVPPVIGEPDNASEKRTGMSAFHSGSEAIPPIVSPVHPPVLPPGFEVLRQVQGRDELLLTVRAAPTAWESLNLPGAEVRTLSVEDIFIALVAAPAALI